MLQWLKFKDTSRPLDRPLRIACLATLWFSVIPLLFSMPPVVALVLLGIPGSAALVSMFKRLHWVVRGGLLFFCGFLIVSVQAGMSDFRTTFIALMLAAVLMKGTEIRTARDGYSVVGFSFLGPFVGFVMEMGGPFNTVTAGVVLLVSLMLAGLLAEWQDHLPLRRARQHLVAVSLLALSAIPLAAIAFWSIPRLDAPLWGIPTASQSKTGIGNTMSPGDVGSLMEDPSTAFRVDFEGRRPSNRFLYWRGLTLAAFDGRTWSEQAPGLDPVTGTLPTPRFTTSSATPVSYSISMEPSDQTYLLALDYLVSAAPKGSRQLYDGRLVAQQPIRRLMRLEGLTSDPMATFDAQPMPALERQRYTALPAGFNPKTVAMGQAWKAQGLSPQQIIDKALALYRKEFSYSLRPPLLGRHSVDEFMFQTRTGFCEHYSSSFAVLMRSAGVPTRVVLGYQGGVLNEFGDYWRVRQADAHAWNEVWLEGKGWVRVDPTAALQSERPPSSGQEDSVLRNMGGNGPLLDWVRQSWGTWFERFDSDRQRDLLRMAGLEGVSPVAVGTLAVICLVVVFWISARLFLRERKQREPEEMRAWRKMLRRTEGKGYRVFAHEPPLTFSQRMAQEISGPQGQEWLACGQAFCDWLYAGKTSPGLAQRIAGLRPPKRKKRA